MDTIEDPHTVLHLYEGDGGVIIRENGNVSTFGVQSDAVTAAFYAASDDTDEATTRDLLATIAGLRQQLERVNEECRMSMRTIAEERARAERAEADNARLQSALDARPAVTEAEVEAAEADNARLVEFAQEMCRVGFDGGSLDGCDILDTAVKHGLCRITEYHSGMTGITNAEYFEEGDAVYVFDGPLFRAARQATEEKTDG